MFRFISRLECHVHLEYQIGDSRARISRFPNPCCYEARVYLSRAEVEAAISVRPDRFHLYVLETIQEDDE